MGGLCKGGRLGLDRPYYVCERGHPVMNRTDGSCPECDLVDLKARMGTLEARVAELERRSDPDED